MTLICCTVTRDYAVITGDTQFTNIDGTFTVSKKVFKFKDLLIGASGSGGAVRAIDEIMKGYSGVNAFGYMQNLAKFFRDNAETVVEDRYSQFLYISSKNNVPFFGIVDTKGDHQTIDLPNDKEDMFYHGIGEPNGDLSKQSAKTIQTLSIPNIKYFHHDYIRRVAEISDTVNEQVHHEIINF